MIPLVPAKAGTQGHQADDIEKDWMPAFAGMSGRISAPRVSLRSTRATRLDKARSP